MKSATKKQTATQPKNKRLAKVDTANFNDDSVLTANELAAFMRTSRFSIYRDRKAGYAFEFGTGIRARTSPGHYKKWLRAQAQKAVVTTAADLSEQEAELHRLR